jgi:hypothetical protein
MITVKVGQVPGRIQEVALNERSTVRQALQIAGISVGDGYTVTINGANASMESTVCANSTILVTRRIKGN